MANSSWPFLFQSWPGHRQSLPTTLGSPIHQYRLIETAKQCLKQKTCEDAFAKRLKEVLIVFEQEGLDTLAEEIWMQIRPEVEADPRKESGDFEDQVDTTIGFIRETSARINDALSSHGY